MSVEYVLAGDRFRPPKKKQDREPHKPVELPRNYGPFIVSISPEAQKDYEELPGNVKEAMDQIMGRLRAWPEVSGVRSLFGKGYAANKFRMKTWDWRVEFLVDQASRTITVIRVGHRDTFYDEYH